MSLDESIATGDSSPTPGTWASEVSRILNNEHAGYIAHGATAGTSRPKVNGTAAEVVFWDGSVEPTNAVDGDFWWDTDSGDFKRKVSGTFQAAGRDTYATANTAGDVAEPLVDSIYIPAASMKALQNATEGDVNRWFVWECTVNSILVASAFFPSHWSTYDLDLHWTTPGAFSGDVEFTIRRMFAGHGDTLALPSGTTPPNFTAPAQNVLEIDTLWEGQAITAGEEHNFNIIRSAGGDTYGTSNPLAVVGMTLRKAS